MYSGEEMELENKNKLNLPLCFACLSSNRTLYKLGNNTNLFFKILDDNYSHPSVVLLCWECTALLKKVRLFKEKVDRAQMLLSYHCRSIKDTSITLSTLATVAIDPQNTVFITEEDMTKNVKPEIEVKVEWDSYEEINIFDGFNQEYVKNEIISENEHAPNTGTSNCLLNYQPQVRNTEDDFKIGNTTKKKGKEHSPNQKKFLKSRRCQVDCSDCKSTFPSKIKFKHHYRAHHSKCTCDYCGQTFSSKKVIKNHIIRNHCPIVCELCRKAFRRRAEYQRHLNAMHGERINEDTYCVPCDKQLLSRFAYKQHILYSLVHATEQEISSQKSKRKKEKVPCPECPKVYSNRYTMTNHYQYVHKRDSRYKCQYCGKQLISATRLSEHISSIHEGIKPEKNKLCTFCGRGFSDNRALAQHMRTHTGERPYQCEHCDARFTQRTPMMTHIKAVHLKMRR